MKKHMTRKSNRGRGSGNRKFIMQSNKISNKFEKYENLANKLLMDLIAKNSNKL